VLIDVREPDEHAQERIAGARLVPLSKFDPKCAAGVKPGQRVVFHCRGGKRAADACRMAICAAGPNVEIFNMTGGIEAWKKDALPIQ
jgi:rhodanese-related sulfurtransferase